MSLAATSKGLGTLRLPGLHLPWRGTSFMLLHSAVVLFMSPAPVPRMGWSCSPSPLEETILGGGLPGGLSSTPGEQPAVSLSSGMTRLGK